MSEKVLQAEIDRLAAALERAERERDMLKAVQETDNYILFCDLETRVEKAERALAEIADTSPNWMEQGAVADSERRMRG